jgi:glycosyltransferase involved in cell wall biosynthesis
MLFVVDRGTDRILDILGEIAATEPSVRVLALSARFGQQAALLAGLDPCDSDSVAMMDSDGQHPPSLIPCLLAGFEQGFDVVYSVREEGNAVPPAQAAELPSLLPPSRLDVGNRNRRGCRRFPARVAARRRGLPDADPRTEPVPPESLLLGWLWFCSSSSAEPSFSFWAWSANTWAIRDEVKARPHYIVEQRINFPEGG